MDVELQILKHLPRSPETTVSVVDQYCDSYQEMFGDVIPFPMKRSFIGKGYQLLGYL